MRYRTNQPVRGTPKTITVRREGHRWFVTVFCVNVPARPLPETGRVVGLDVGIAHLVTLSDGTTIPNLRPGRREAKTLAVAQQDLAARKRGSARRRRAAQRIATVHRKVARRRLDHVHKTSRALVDAYDVLVHEDLKIINMTRRAIPRPEGQGGYEPNGAAAKSGLNRSILDAGWGALLRMLAWKAEDAARTVIAVDPRHSSQRCSACGHTEKANRVTQAEFRCRSCGFHGNADTNAAINILRAGLAQRDAQAEREERVIA